MLGWGHRATKQLGEEDNDADMKKAKVLLLDFSTLQSGATSISHVAAGWDSTFLIATSGQIYALGKNTHGQLGLGHKNHRAVPCEVDLNGEHVHVVAAGSHHAVAAGKTLATR